MRIALAIVSGSLTISPSTIGALPAAWKPNIRGQLRGDAARELLAVAARVGGVVAGVADRDEVEVGGVAEHLDDLERRGLLPLDAVVVDRVDEVHRVVGGELAGDVEAVVEVALHLQQLGVVRDGLAELAHRDLALGHEHDGRDAGVRRRRRRPRREVLPVEAQMTAFAPCSTAFEMAMVMPRSLKEPVGFMPSNLTQTLAPVRAESAAAGMSGVPPSPSVTIGVASLMSSRSAYSRRTPRHCVSHLDVRSHCSLDSQHARHLDHHAARRQGCDGGGECGLGRLVCPDHQGSGGRGALGAATDCCTASTETPCSANMVAIAASTPGSSATSRVIW